jgi:hypothetical protein
MTQDTDSDDTDQGRIARELSMIGGLHRVSMVLAVGFGSLTVVLSPVLDTWAEYTGLTPSMIAGAAAGVLVIAPLVLPALQKRALGITGSSSEGDADHGEEPPSEVSGSQTYDRDREQLREELLRAHAEELELELEQVRELRDQLERELRGATADARVASRGEAIMEKPRTDGAGDSDREPETAVIEELENGRLRCGSCKTFVTADTEECPKCEARLSGRRSV